MGKGDYEKRDQRREWEGERMGQVVGLYGNEKLEREAPELEKCRVGGGVRRTEKSCRY